MMGLDSVVVSILLLFDTPLSVSAVASRLFATAGIGRGP
jgi:hypothetical protein